MSLRNFAPVRALLRAFNAPSALEPVPMDMARALASIDRLGRLADERSERVRQREVAMADVVDDLVTHR